MDRRRPLQELLNTEEPAWPLVASALRNSSTSSVGNWPIVAAGNATW